MYLNFDTEIKFEMSSSIDLPNLCGGPSSNVNNEFHLKSDTTAISPYPSEP